MTRTWPQHARKLAWDIVAFAVIYAAGALILTYLVSEGEL